MSSNKGGICSICGSFFEKTGFCKNGHTRKTISLVKFYERAKRFVINQGYLSEIDYVKERKFEDTTSDYFFKEFVYVVLNSGMKNQVAEKIYRKFMEGYSEVLHGNKAFVTMANDTIGHPGKNRAIKEAYWHHRYWFKLLKQKETLEAQLEFLQSLPWIGKITKYHLARNIGIDVAKPDRHMIKVAKYFGFDDVQKMCSQLSEVKKDRVGVVDVIIWRAMNLNNGDLKRFIRKQNGVY